MRILLLALALAGAAGLAQAQDYPSRPITLIIPTAVGGATTPWAGSLPTG